MLNLTLATISIMIEAMKPTTPQEYSDGIAAAKSRGLLGLADKGDAAITRVIEGLPQTSEARRRRRVFGASAVALALIGIGVLAGPSIVDRFNGPEFSEELIEVPIVQPGQIVDGIGATDLYGVADQVENSGVPTDVVTSHIENMPQNEAVFADNQLDPGEVVVAPKEVNP